MKQGLMCFKFLGSAAVFTVIVLFIHSGQGDIVCDTGFKLCGYECYDPTTLDCMEVDGNKIVCPKGMKACGDGCYSTGQCLQKDGISVTCLKDQQQCGEQCFTPGVEKCINNTIACNINDGVCGTGFRVECYKPDKSDCTPQGRVCRTGQESCGHDCYNPTEGKTCFENRILCHEGRKLCGRGYQCYSELFNETCINGRTVCKVGEVLCGKDSCYDPNNSEIKCNVEEGSGIGIVCRVEQDVCEGKCVDKTSAGCFPYRGLGLTCPIGQKGCGGLDCFTPDVSAEDGHVYQCLTSAYDEEVLCKNGQSLCGSICFNPQPDGTGLAVQFKCLQSQDNVEILCRMHEEICGDSCYDAKTQICYPTKDDAPVWD